MIESIPIILVLVIIFISSFVRGSIGFGNALIAMPLLALVMDIKMTTALIALVSVFMSISMLIKGWRNVDFKSVWLLLVGAAIGTPFGLLLLNYAPEKIVKIILGILLILYSIYNLLKPDLPKIKNKIFGFSAGFLGGVLGGAYNTNGPPVIVYGSFAKWEPEEFKASLQGFFAPSGVMILIGHASIGLWTNQLLMVFLLSLPVVFIATIIGGKVTKYFKKEIFSKIVYCSLILMGFLMFI